MFVNSALSVQFGQKPHALLHREICVGHNRSAKVPIYLLITKGFVLFCVGIFRAPALINFCGAGRL